MNKSADQENVHRRDDSNPKQHNLRYLFFMTTCVAVGVGLFTQKNSHPGIQLIGLGIIDYWIAKGFFAVSTRLTKPFQEIVFLLGLPFFAGFLYCTFTGSVGLIADLVDHLTSRITESHNSYG